MTFNDIFFVSIFSYNQFKKFVDIGSLLQIAIVDKLEEISEKRFVSVNAMVS
jgi:hypothetical protein